MLIHGRCHCGNIAFDEPSLLRRVPSTLEGETEDERLARRKRHWIARVVLRR